MACIGFIILGIVIDCGRVSTDPRGYIGARYWYQPGAFLNGFQGFCSVFVTAAFAFGGTELVGLAAAEADNPQKTLPKATKQVFWRISFFYIVTLFIVGLIVPADSDRLVGTSGSDTKASPFVIAIEIAGIRALPSIFNVVITISVLSVANSCTYASSRTMQALGAQGMGPKFLTYIDRQGRPLWCIVIQLVFGLLAFINEASVGTKVFTWLLSLSGLSYFFCWASICLAHIRFRRGWKVQGHSLEELPYRASFGVIGSYIGLFLNVVALIATFYVSLVVRKKPPSPSPAFLFRHSAGCRFLSVALGPHIPNRPVAKQQGRANRGIITQLISFCCVLDSRSVKHPMPRVSSANIWPAPSSLPCTFSGR